MEEGFNQKLRCLKFRLFERRIDEFCNQLNSIMLAIELLQVSSHEWKEVEKQYFDCIKTTIYSLAKAVRSSPTFLGLDEDSLYDYLDNLGLAWWVEIFTTSPRVTYYFGPFVTAQEAELAKSGYIEDLENEGSQVLTVQIQQCQPNFLTISENEPSEKSDWGAVQVFNPQFN